MDRAPPRKIDQHRQDKPHQLALFERLLPADCRFSNTIELYDFIPKYFWGKSERENAKFLQTLRREFECRGKRYKVAIEPARLADKNGVEREHYPARREELVEDALRKFVCEGQGVFLDNQAGVTFTLYQLQQELKRSGHTFSINELKDALLICAKVKLVLTDDEGRDVLVSSLFETIGLQTRDDWKEQGQKTRAYVRFNPLVTRCIETLQFRQLDYGRSMSLNSVIARQLHKRLSHHYTQASLTNPFAILLSTVIRDFGLTRYKELRNNLRDVTTALEELKNADVLLFYNVERITGPKRNTLLDAKLVLTPTSSFSGDVVQANQRHAAITHEATRLLPGFAA